MRRVVLPLCWLACLAAAGAQAPSRSGTAVIAGTVVNAAAAGEPVRRVTVTLSDASGGRGRAAVTDDAGRFAFPALPAGRYQLSAWKAAYLPTAYGVTRPVKPGSVFAGTAISLSDGQRFENVTLPITRGGVVTGTVRTPDGRLVRDGQVFLVYFTRNAETGVRTLTPLRDGATASDGRGLYRIFGVPPGEYVVVLQMPYGLRDLEQTTEADIQRVADPSRLGGVASGASLTSLSPAAVPARPKFGYAPVYFPGTSVLSEAITVTLGAGEERGGVDFEVRMVPNARLNGRAVGPDGRPVAAQIKVTRVVGGADFLGQFASSDVQGRFTTTGLEPGAYSIDAQTSPGRGANAPMMAGRTEVSIGSGSDVEATVTLHPGVSVAGRLVFETAGATAPVDPSRVRVTVGLDSAGVGSANSVNATAAADGSFTAGGVFPGRYRLRATVTGPPASTAAWFVKSATMGGRDVLDGAFEVGAGDMSGAIITMTTRVSEVAGVIQDAAGRAAPEYFIIAFPADRALWMWNSRRIQQARPSHDGAFAFRNLPAGDYLIGAVTDVEQHEWFEPAFLDGLVGVSVKLTLAEGQKAVQNLRVK
jgi:hypothetical protein